MVVERDAKNNPEGWLVVLRGEKEKEKKKTERNQDRVSERDREKSKDTNRK